MRELWHIEHPLNDSVPFPEGVVSMEEWSQTVITMQKYAGRTFGQLLDSIKAGDRDVIQYSSWAGPYLFSAYHKDSQVPGTGFECIPSPFRF